MSGMGLSGYRNRNRYWKFELFPYRYRNRKFRYMVYWKKFISEVMIFLPELYRNRYLRCTGSFGMSDTRSTWRRRQTETGSSGTPKLPIYCYQYRKLQIFKRMLTYIFFTGFFQGFLFTGFFCYTFRCFTPVSYYGILTVLQHMKPLKITQVANLICQQDCVKLCSCLMCCPGPCL
jgi:hypothetical protein